MKHILFFPLAFLSMVLAAPAQQVVRLNGSSTLTEKITPIAAEVGQAHKVELKLNPNGVGHGIADLATGKADIAMVIGPVDYYVGLINKKTPGLIDPAKLKRFPMNPKCAGPGTLVAHKDLPVSALTRDEIELIFAGTLTNWSKLGGPNLPIVPVLHDPMNGYMATFTVIFIHGEPNLPNAKIVNRITEVCDVVAATPGAISFVSKAVADKADNVRKVSTTPVVSPTSYLVTLGEPSGAIKAVIDDLVAKTK